MTNDATRNSSPSGLRRSIVSDVALIATLACVLVILFVSMKNQQAVGQLSARVKQLETLASAAKAEGGSWNKVYDIKTETAPAKGANSAPVTIVEFAEFQCPFCERVGPTLERIQNTYKDRVRFVWKHFPLRSHAHAMDAAVAAEAARNQDRFWEYHDKLFSNQEQLEPQNLRQYAQALGLDLARFDRDREDQAVKAKVLEDMTEATSLSVTATPTFFINGRLVSGAMPFETFATIIDEELAKLDPPAPSKPSAN